MPDRKSPRLIPQHRQRELRAVSALLAVLEVSPKFAELLLGPLGATGHRSVKAEVEPALGDGGYGDGFVDAANRRSSWKMLIEAKTGGYKLSQVQIDREWRAACANEYDCLLTISNDLNPTVTVPSTPRNPSIKHEHLSWIEILTKAQDAMRRMQETGDAEWRVVKELVRYLDDPATEVLKFDSMPGSWSRVRQGIRSGSYKKPNDEELLDVVRRIDELFTYCSLVLISEFDDVVEYQSQTAESLATDAINGKDIVGRLKSDRLGGDLEIRVNLMSSKVTYATMTSPHLANQPKTSARKLTGRLESCPNQFKRQVSIETWEHYGREPVDIVRVDRAIDDHGSLVPSGRGKKIKGFKLVRSTDLVTRGHKRGKSPGFIQDVESKLKWFYEPLRELRL